VSQGQIVNEAATSAAEMRSACVLIASPSGPAPNLVNNGHGSIGQIIIEEADNARASNFSKCLRPLRSFG
jgi:type III secretion system FlhB-like substrate exporter